MYWVNEDTTYYYNFSKEDPEYSANLKRNETNTFAEVYSSLKVLKRGNLKYGYNRRYDLVLGGIQGELKFKRLKDAKQFALQTLVWIRDKQEKKRIWGMKQ